jgi:hypothetical protein
MTKSWRQEKNASAFFGSQETAVLRILANSSHPQGSDEPFRFPKGRTGWRRIGRFFV